MSDSGKPSEHGFFHPNWDFETFTILDRVQQSDFITQFLGWVGFTQWFCESEAIAARRRGMPGGVYHLKSALFDFMVFPPEKSVSIYFDFEVSQYQPPETQNREPLFQGSAILLIRADGECILESLRINDAADAPPRPMSVYIDPGGADADTIRDLFLALDAVYRARGGSGLEIVKHTIGHLVAEEVPV